MPRPERDSEDSPETPSGRGTGVLKSDFVARRDDLLKNDKPGSTFDGVFHRPSAQQWR
jgi:hypothetical protein